MDNTLSSQPSDSGIEEELRRGMLSAVADDLVRIIMSLDAVHFKSMLDQTRATTNDQEDELRRRQDIIMELESKVRTTKIIFQENIFKFFYFSYQFVKLNSEAVWRREIKLVTMLLTVV